MGDKTKTDIQALEGFIPIKMAEGRKGGWTIDPETLEAIQKKVAGDGWDCGQWEGIQEVLLAVGAHHLAAALSRTPGEAMAWLQENPVFGKELVFDTHLTAGDKANGWTETPLYAHPAPAAPAGEIEALAKRLWSVHPKEVQDSGLTRSQWYAREIQAYVDAALAKMTAERDEARELCYSMRSNDEEIRKAVERSGFASDTWIVHALDQSSDRADGWEARALAAEAALAKAVKALKEIEDHPENSSGTSRSYGVGWAFWNVQNIARCARAATPETESRKWPDGCSKQRSCSRNRGCMYGCKAHAGRPPEAVRSEIDAEIALRDRGNT